MENLASASVVGFENGMRHISTNKQGLETTVIKVPRKIEVQEFSNEKEFLRCTYGFAAKGERRPHPEKVELIKLANGIETVRFFNTKEESDFVKFIKHHPFTSLIVDGSFEAERAKWLNAKAEKLAVEFGKTDMNLRSFTTTKRVALRNESKAIQGFNYDEKERQKKERELIKMRSKPNGAK